MATQQDVSAYEAKRLQRMRENQEKMASLGMQKLAPQHVPAKRKPGAAAAAAIEAARANPRRSARISTSSQRSATLLTALDQSVLLTARGRRRKAPLPRWIQHEPHRERAQAAIDRARASNDQYVPVADRVSAPTTAAALAPRSNNALSSSKLAIDVNAFHARWLAKQIWPRGKHTVMQGMCVDHTPLFSILSGVQLWRNAIALFVNVEGNGLYTNTFHEVEVKSDGHDDASTTVYFEWFAQARHRVTSPAIKRLLRALKGDACFRVDDATYYELPPPVMATTNDDTSNDSNNAVIEAPDPVLLFLRHVDGPYIYCGRLGFLGYHAGSQPLAFRWQLLDVATREWQTIQSLIAATSERVDGAAVTEA